MARTIAKVDVTWTGWMLGFLPVGVVLFVLTPLVTYVVYPPSITNGSRVAMWAATELRQMGPVSRREITMAILAIVALAGWIFGSAFVAAVTVSFIVISLMLLTGVVTWNDILNNAHGVERAVLVFHVAGAGERPDRGRLHSLACQPECGTAVDDARDGGRRRHRGLVLPAPLSVREHVGAHRRRAAGLSGGGRCVRQRACDASRCADASLHRSA